MKTTSSILLLFVLFIAQSDAQNILRSEILGRPTDNSITVQLQFADSAEVRIEYGTQTGVYSSQTAWTTVADSTPINLQITGLAPNTRYFYRVRHRLPGATAANPRPEYNFTTARPAGEPFTFVIQADPHLDSQTDTAILNRCLQNQLEDNPDFMIDLGDIIMTDKLKNAANVVTRDTVSQRAAILRSYYEKVCHSVPLFIAIGNHESECGWYLNGTPNNLAIWGTEERKKNFINPAPDNFYSGDTATYPFVGARNSYYSFTWGDALFVVLDPYWNTTPKPDSLHGWYWTLGRAQYDWLKHTLENSPSTFKFIFCHQLVGGDPDGRGGIEFADLYEWGGSNLDGTPGFSTNRPGWYKPIKDLLKENRVTAFFHGHDHFFAKQEKDCLIYQECPQPGHFNFNNANQAAVYGYLQGQILPNAGHLRVSVAPTGIQVEYVRAYKASDETPTRQNKDISATYFIGAVNCYDSLSTGIPVLYNSDYTDHYGYPNPFSETTTICISLPENDNVTIILSDVNGKTVRHLLNSAPTPKGRFELQWDGSNDNGERAAAGNYTYTILTEKGIALSGKLVLTR